MFLLTATVAFCQWSKTAFADGVGIDAMVAQGTNVFIAGGGGGFVPIPVGAKPGDLHDRAASFEGGYNHAHIGNVTSLDSLGTGIFMSSDSGATWESAGLQDTTVFAMAVVGKYLFAADGPGEIFRTSDDGVVWDSVASLGSGWVQSFDVDSIAPSKALIFYASWSIFVSKDTGRSWVQLSAGLPHEEGGVTCLASNGPDLFAGTFDGYGPINESDFSGIFRSTDYGVHWNVVDTVRTPQCIAARGNLVLVGSEGGVYASTDSGRTWTTRNQNLGFSSLQFIGNNILATSGGIYRSVDNGNTWIAVDTSAVSSTFGMLSFTPTDVYAVSGIPHTDLPRLFMGPASEVVRAPISGVTPVIEPPRTIPSSFSLSQNYPNPFNPSTAIGYQLSAVSRVSLKAYDVLGRLVKTLVNNEVESAGNYEVRFDGSGLASGVYFYRLTASPVSGANTGYTKVMKMVLLK